MQRVKVRYAADTGAVRRDEIRLLLRQQN